MTTTCDISVSKWFVAAMLAAVTQFVIAPNGAQAGCGDYVLLGRHATHSVQLASNNDRMPRQPAAAENMTDSHLTHSDLSDWSKFHGIPIHGRRCSGPNCSNDGPPPPDEPTAPFESDVSQWGLTAVEWLPTNLVRQIGQLAGEPLLVKIATGSVYRPPR